MTAESLHQVGCMLLDIEGTVCSISFVRERLFPYAIDVLPETAKAKWDDPEFKSYVSAFPELAQKSAKAFSDYAIDLMKQDSKVPYLKKLQGYLWKNGWNTGAFVAPLYPDVVPALRAWHAADKQIVIFSSGSVPAQKLLFGHVGAEGDNSEPTSSSEAASGATDKKRTSSEAQKDVKDAEKAADETTDPAAPHAKKPKTADPIVNPPAKLPEVQTKTEEVQVTGQPSEDINPLLADYFDTQNAGPKQEKESYEKIAKALGKECGTILFLSDNVKEVKAALEAGMKSLVIDRPGNEPLSEEDRAILPVYTSFADIALLQEA
ncbi:uncharacterized protein K452DRAFT_294664 [Aplosporella prunicola CBS 121167]|uniref:Enolase-phosphatase E1 n=1 Tax=Aplosporella prunicola CBS 121167 TaxID=1176127 RepID=A0A6A6BS55_9PEZI|nr:uncharacterized protein K452DRAFT_294664 [Aplosporella prunicola CBS 121167]KAF2146054.1 hypothetical protein K452DRAFT_294664 [Aplosporella prunicola CBS 121167]